MKYEQTKIKQQQKFSHKQHQETFFVFVAMFHVAH